MQFEDIVWRYYAPLLSYVRSIGGEEDHVQEAFIAAYKAYSGYVEQGKTLAWLKTIARRIVYREKANIPILVSYDAPDFDEFPLSDGDSLYDDLACADGCAQILAAIKLLPERQRNVVYYRIFGGFSVAETAKMLNLPAGTVRSNSHYGMANLKLKLKPYLIEGEHIMNCTKTLEYLWQYARDAILTEDKANVEQHLEACTECRDIADSLRKLVAHIKPAPKDVMRHCNITFQLNNGQILTYCDGSAHMPNFAELNERLAKVNGIIPDDKQMEISGFGTAMNHIAEFDNEGNRIGVVIFQRDEHHKAIKYREIKKVFEYHQSNSVYLNSDYGVYKKSTDVPNQYIVKTNNGLGQAARSGLFVAIPGKAKNVRMVQGTDVVDCGAYKFVYVDGYVVEGQLNAVEATYEM